MLETIDLRTAREHCKMYAKDVAKKMNKTQSWLLMIETGQREISARNLIELMSLYGLSDLKLSEIFLPKKTTKSSKKQHKLRK